MADQSAALAMSDEIVKFWTDAGGEKWYKQDDAFDQEITERFGACVEAVALPYNAGLSHNDDLNEMAANHKDEFAPWLESFSKALSYLLLLDQFPRNMYRGSPKAYLSDVKASAFADQAIAQGVDMQSEMPLRQFFYLPFMHREDLALQERCTQLCQERANEDNVKFAKIHEDIIRRFGRFPHRNEVLGRVSTAEEITFLEEGGFSA